MKNGILSLFIFLMFSVTAYASSYQARVRRCGLVLNAHSTIGSFSEAQSEQILIMLEKEMGQIRAILKNAYSSHLTLKQIWDGKYAKAFSSDSSYPNLLSFSIFTDFPDGSRGPIIWVDIYYKAKPSGDNSAFFDSSEQYNVELRGPSLEEFQRSQSRRYYYYGPDPSAGTT